MRMTADDDIGAGVDELMAEVLLCAVTGDAAVGAPVTVNDGDIRVLGRAVDHTVVVAVGRSQHARSRLAGGGLDAVNVGYGYKSDPVAVDVDDGILGGVLQIHTYSVIIDIILVEVLYQFLDGSVLIVIRVVVGYRKDVYTGALQSRQILICTPEAAFLAALLICRNIILQYSAGQVGKGQIGVLHIS